MIQNLLPLLPRRLGTGGTAIALVSALVGCGLWLIGARFSRPLLALAASVGGGAIGFQSPGWFGWHIDPWTVAVGGSLVLGVFAFMAHRWIAAVGLGMVLGVWACLTTIACVGLTDQWVIPAIMPGEMFWTWLVVFPHSIPDSLSLWVLTSLTVGLLGGLALAYFWERLGVVLFWSMLGLMLCILPALCVAQAADDHYLRLLPSRADGQAAILIALIALGAGLQWKFTFRKRPAKAAGAK